MSEDAKPVIHVVFGASGAGSLRAALARLGLNQTVLGFPEDLSFGPIDPSAPVRRDEWMRDVFEEDGSYEEYRQRAEVFWQQATDSAVFPVAWLSRRDAREYAAFLEFLWRIGDQPFRVV